MQKRLLLILVIASGLLATVIHVPADSPSIQGGIDSAFDGDTVLVAPGEYLENINFNGKAIFLSSHHILEQDTSHISSTIIDGSSAVSPVVIIPSRIDTNSVLNGFTITGGRGLSLPDINVYAGGGVLVTGGAKITNNHIIHNHLQSSIELHGAGVFIFTRYLEDEDGGTVVLNDNTIAHNSISGSEFIFGGGVSIAGFGTIRVSNNIISHNSISGQSTVIGGGISLFNVRDVVVSQNMIKANNVSAINPIDYISGGGGVFIYGRYPILKRNVIIDNHAPNGGGLAAWGNQIGFNFRLINNTIAFNHALRTGGGLYLTNGHCDAVNNIIWANTAEHNSDIYIRGNLNISYSITQEVFPGIGNLQIDPHFEDTQYHLSNTSPAIDAGNPDPEFYDDPDPANPSLPLWPAMGGLHADMGAYGGNDTMDVEVGAYAIQENFLYGVHEDMHYRFAYPLDYDSTSLYPLSIVLHGFDQWGTDNELQLYEGLPWRANAEHFGYNEFTLVPQAPTMDWSSTKIATVYEIIRSVIEGYPIDTTRIVISGWSNGGGGVWRMLSHDHDLFAAAISLSTITGPFAGTQYTPTWLNNGSEDGWQTGSRIDFYERTGLTTVYAEDSTDTQLMNAINNNARIIYSEFEGAGHGIVKHTFDNFFLFEWLKQQILTRIRPQESYLNYINDDSVQFNAVIANPHDFPFENTLNVTTFDHEPISSLSLYDDGEHGDSLANDGVWGNYIEMPEQLGIYKLGIEIRNLENDTEFNFQDMTNFTNRGPLSFESVEQLHPTGGAIPPNTRIYFHLSLRNLGLSAIENISVRIEPADSNTIFVSGETYSLVEDMEAGGVGSTLSYLALLTAEDCEVGTPLYFNITINNENIPFWKDTGVLLGFVGTEDDHSHLPEDYDLLQNYPNPFNPSTTISYALPVLSEVSIDVYDVRGQTVSSLISTQQTAGYYEIIWNGLDDSGNQVSAGMYFCKLHAEGFSKTVKLVYLK
ncbi:MAG: T9SS type A sorting domain-containing protein [FCB group bacterium]|nr:T9SS type A sorting domain-containing protein [FCB group bacterium]